MTPDQLKEVLRLHELWIDGDPKGVRANLAGVDLKRANLLRANLEGANLEGANLQRVNLWEMNFYGRKIVHCDLDRNYVLYVLPYVKDGPRFIAGCRNFTYKEAIEHWTHHSYQPKYVKAIQKYMKNKGYKHVS